MPINLAASNLDSEQGKTQLQIIQEQFYAIQKQLSANVNVDLKLIKSAKVDQLLLLIVRKIESIVQQAKETQHSIIFDPSLALLYQKVELIDQQVKILALKIDEIKYIVYALKELSLELKMDEDKLLIVAPTVVVPIVTPTVTPLSVRAGKIRSLSPRQLAQPAISGSLLFSTPIVKPRINIKPAVISEYRSANVMLSVVPAVIPPVPKICPRRRIL